MQTPLVTWTRPAPCAHPEVRPAPPVRLTVAEQKRLVRS